MFVMMKGQKVVHVFVKYISVKFTNPYALPYETKNLTI